MMNDKRSPIEAEVVPGIGWVHPDHPLHPDHAIIEAEIKEYLAGLIGIPLVFDGNNLCPSCLRYAMNVMGGTWICDNCHSTFPGTIVVDKWGQRWLNLQRGHKPPTQALSEKQ